MNGPVRITAAAIIGKDGAINTLPPPARHHDIIRAMAAAGQSTPIIGPQGFMTSDGDFVGRTAAFRIARDAGQLLRETTLPVLFSEDVW